MPIKPENRNRYPVNWKGISSRIRFDRAGSQCECEGECGLHHDRRCEERHGQPAKRANGKSVLTVAHLDHVPENCSDDNLRALCQRCHLRYDVDHHRKSRSPGAQERKENDR